MYSDCNAFAFVHLKLWLIMIDWSEDIHIRNSVIVPFTFRTHCHSPKLTLKNEHIKINYTKNKLILVNLCEFDTLVSKMSRGQLLTYNNTLCGFVFLQPLSVAIRLWAAPSASVRGQAPTFALWTAHSVPVSAQHSIPKFHYSHEVSGDAFGGWFGLAVTAFVTSTKL